MICAMRIVEELEGEGGDGQEKSGPPQYRPEELAKSPLEKGSGAVE